MRPSSASSEAMLSSTVGLNTATRGFRDLQHYMTLEEAFATKRISSEGNRPCLLSDHEMEHCRRVGRAMTVDAADFKERVASARATREVQTQSDCGVSPVVRRRPLATPTRAQILCRARVECLFGERGSTEGCPSHWNKLPPAVLLKVARMCMTSSVSSAVDSERAATGSLTHFGADSGNCQHLLALVSVCKSWRHHISNHPGILRNVKVAIDITRPFTHLPVSSRLIRFMECPPFPVVIQKAADAGNPSACNAVASLMDLQGLHNQSEKYWMHAVGTATRELPTVTSPPLAAGHIRVLSENSIQLVV